MKHLPDIRAVRTTEILNAMIDFLESDAAAEGEHLTVQRQRRVAVREIGIEVAAVGEHNPILGLPVGMQD